MCTPKTVAESRSTQVHILMPGDLNGYGRLFGGKLMEWIDVVAAVVARRHSGCEVTTASVDHLEFKSPAHVNTQRFSQSPATNAGKNNSRKEKQTDEQAEFFQRADCGTRSQGRDHA